MLDSRFVLLGVAFNIIGNSSYIVAVLKGQARPNRVTWFFWALAPLVAFFAELTKGVGLQALMTFMVGFGPLLIFLASFVNKKAYWKITIFDWWCGAFSLFALALWAVTREGNVAIIFSILADLLAGVPTLIKSYREPQHENPGVFALGALSAGITLLTIKDWTFANYGFPVYILVICTLLAGLIAYPRAKHKEAAS